MQVSRQCRAHRRGAAGASPRPADGRRTMPRVRNCAAPSRRRPAAMRRRRKNLARSCPPTPPWCRVRPPPMRGAPTSGGQVNLVALLTVDGQRIDQGLVWRIFASTRDPRAESKLLMTQARSQPDHQPRARRLHRQRRLRPRRHHPQDRRRSRRRDEREVRPQCRRPEGESAGRRGGAARQHRRL